MKVITKLLLFIVLFLTACAGAEQNLQFPPLNVPPALSTIDNRVIPVTETPFNQPDSSSVAGDPQPTITSTVIPASPTAQEMSPTPAAYPAPINQSEVILSSPAPPDAAEPPDLYPAPSDDQIELPVFGYRVINVYPHDPEAYTQGLVVTGDGRKFIEGTGLWGQSSLRLVDIETGEIDQYKSIADEYFGEGLTEFQDRIYQLTWRANIGFIYDSQSFELLRDFSYPHEGWGITHDGSQLIVSDGTSTIHFWDPQTLNETKQIQVSSSEGPVSMLNELEFVEGEIFANIWQTDLIARISPETGEVLGWIDLTGLYEVGEDASVDNVLNGIAYDEKSGKLFVTGKRWPVLFEIELIRNGS